MARETVLAGVAEQVVAVRTGHAVRVAIDGIDAAGKTTLANELVPLIRARGRPVIRASIDGFHNPRAIRYALGPLSPEGYFDDSFNLPALVTSLLAPLGPGGDGRYRTTVFDHRSDTPVNEEDQQAPAGAILLFDGIFLARPELAAYWDLFLFVQIGFDTYLARALERDRVHFASEEELLHRYQARYLPAQQHYLAACRPTELAGIILDNDDLANPRLTISL